MDSPVMLSPFVALRVNSAKHLEGHGERPFAAAQGDMKEPWREAGGRIAMGFFFG